MRFDILSLGRILGRIRIGGQPSEVFRLFIYFFFLDDEFSDGQLPTGIIINYGYLVYCKVQWTLTKNFSLHKSETAHCLL